MANFDPLKAYKSGFQGTAEWLKGKESLSDYQKNYKPAEDTADDDARMRGIVLNF